MKKPIQPGELFKASQKGHKGVHHLMKHMKSSVPVRTSGAFHGKSNALGHGGRAAQLKARGVPGGVIGTLARAAHAAPGQANFHGKHAKRKSHKRKVAMPDKGDLGMALKGAHHKAAVHHHIHIHGKGTAHIHVGGSHAAHGLHEEKHDKPAVHMKHMKRAHKHHKGTAHIEPAAGFHHAGNLHEEKRDKSACKTCGKVGKHSHKHAKKA